MVEISVDLVSAAKQELGFLALVDRTPALKVSRCLSVLSIGTKGGFSNSKNSFRDGLLGHGPTWGGVLFQFPFIS